MARYTITTHVGAPPEHVFALWTSLERMGEWVGGVTAVSDVSGSVDQAGTTYVVHFGPMKSPTEILEVERPRLFSTKFGSWILRGRSSATFEPEVDGTRITQTFETVGLISAISSWVFSRGSYEGSFRASSRCSPASPSARRPSLRADSVTRPGPTTRSKISATSLSTPDSRRARG